jgi:hypothetical protein
VAPGRVRGFVLGVLLSSYIAVDLKVIEGLAADCAKSCAATEDRIGWGLVKVWHRCWADKRGTLTRLELAGIFGPQDLAAVVESLVGFGFLEPSGGAWRVRGVEKYLRIQEGRSRGGQAAKGNLRRGNSPAGSRLVPGSPPADSRLASGLSPSTEHRAPNTEHVEDLAPQKAASPDLFPEALPSKAKAPKVKREPDPRHAPLVARLVEAAKRALGSYAFVPRDAKAVSELLAKGTDDEIEARLLKAFAAGGFPSVRTIHELNTHWNHFATDKPTGGFQRPRHPGAPVEPKPFNTGEDLGF